MALSATDTAALITAVGVVLSWIGAVFIAGFRFGSIATRLDRVEKAQDSLATKDQLAGVKEDVAEIKGMFRMTLKDGQ